MLSPATVSVPSSPRQRMLNAQLLAEIDPDSKLTADARVHKLAMARKQYFRELATQSVLSEGSILESLIKATARAIIVEARRIHDQQQKGS